MKIVGTLLLGWGMWTGLRIVEPGLSDIACNNIGTNALFGLVLSCWIG